MIIKTLVETSYRGMFKLTPEEGSSFFIRREYLTDLDFDLLEQGFEATEEQTDELMDAGLCAVVEFKAVDYLARAEQCRAGLRRKLIQKKYETIYIDRALDYLEASDYLSDRRFARAWLNTRSTNHYEGRTRLLSELMNRGINREIAVDSIDEFYSEHDEAEICRKAYEKALKTKSGDKLIAALQRQGFTLKQIREAESTQA